QGGRGRVLRTAGAPILRPVGGVRLARPALVAALAAIVACTAQGAPRTATPVRTAPAAAKHAAPPSPASQAPPAPAPDPTSGTGGSTPSASPPGNAAPTRLVPIPGTVLADAKHLAAARRHIKHVVFVIKENRTFDTYFGRFPGADGATTGRRCN